jgi:hypothetical protein
MLINSRSYYGQSTGHDFKRTHRNPPRLGVYSLQHNEGEEKYPDVKNTEGNWVIKIKIKASTVGIKGCVVEGVNMGRGVADKTKPPSEYQRGALFM